MDEQCLFRFTSGIQCTEPSQHTGAHYHGITQPERDVLERLGWWLTYFNEPDETVRSIAHHPAFRGSPYVPSDFDETAIEEDVADAIAKITELREWKRKVLEAETVAYVVTIECPNGPFVGIWLAENKALAQEQADAAAEDGDLASITALIVAPTEEET